MVVVNDIVVFSWMESVWKWKFVCKCVFVFFKDPQLCYQWYQGFQLFWKGKKFDRISKLTTEYD